MTPGGIWGTPPSVGASSGLDAMHLVTVKTAEPTWTPSASTECH